VLRQGGTARYIARATSTWIFFGIMGVASPLLMIAFAGFERAWYGALVNVIFGAIGAVILSWTLHRKCEAAWQASENS
jgi:hypothetical protein